MVAPDVLYPVRPSPKEDLRYSIRTLRNVPHGNVMLVGAVPAWATCLSIPKPPHRPDLRDAAANILMGMQSDQLTEDVILMMDDVFILNEIPEIPTWHRGPLQKVISHYGDRRSRYLLNMQRTLELLVSLGIPRPLCYELHIPMMVNRQAYLDMLNLIPEDDTIESFSKRTLYGNIAGIGGKQVGIMSDVKVTGMSPRIPRGGFMSTSASGWRGRAGKLIRRDFPDPSPWER